LRTGVLRFDDNSGLTYYDRDGKKVEGALGESEKKFQYIILPILLTIFIIINTFLIYKTFKRKRR